MAKTSLSQTIGAALWVTIVFSGGWFLGMSMMLNAHANAQDPYRSLQLLAQIMRTIERNYIDELPLDSLVDNAITGMVDGLDPHSRYIDPETYKELQRTAAGWSIGIGVQLDSQYKIIDIKPKSPAEAADLQIGDQITAIDSQNIQNEPLKIVEQLLDGAIGTEINIVVQRQGQKLTKVLHREQIATELVTCQALEKGIVHLKVLEFGKGTAQQAKACLKTQSAQQSINGIVLDLRDNLGGLVEEGIELADIFMREGLITTFYERASDTEQRFTAQVDAPHAKTPLVVLINGTTASAAELVAGALQKNDRAYLIGQASYGKGSMQKIYAFDGEAALKLTIAHYQLPDGSVLTRSSPLTPDYSVIDKRQNPKKELKELIQDLPIEDRIKERLFERLDLLEDPSVTDATDTPILNTDSQLNFAWTQLTTPI